MKHALMLAAIAATAFAAAPASAARYTCGDDKPCITQTNELGKHRVDLTYSGKGTSYTFYKITVRPHGGGTARELTMKGGKQGHARIDLKKKGDYEITLAGCLKKGPKGEPTCTPSSEKVRVNLR
jgi:hypothetical protein